MLDFLCSTCGKRSQAAEAIVCPDCNRTMTAVTAIATPEDAANTKLTMPADARTAISEGLPPRQTERELSIAREPVGLFMLSSSTLNVGAVTPPWSDYVINPWLNDPKGGGGNTTTSAVQDNRTKLADITDGTSNTIFFGHGQINTNDYKTTIAVPGYMDTILVGGTTATVLSSNPAAGPVTFAADSSNTRRDAARGWGSPFSQGCLMSMCDATVRMFPYSTGVGSFNNGQGVGAGGAATTLSNFLTPAGNEPVVMVDN